jgi:hypothetical protein
VGFHMLQDSFHRWIQRKGRNSVTKTHFTPASRKS